MKTLIAIPFAALVLSACAVESSDPVAGSNDEALSLGTPSTDSGHNPWWKSQYDGTVCQDENCGPTAIAMMRYAITGGESDHEGGWVRKHIDKFTGTHACVGTNTYQWKELLNETDGNGHWIDGTPKAKATEHCGDGFSAEDLARAMNHGDVAIIAGNANHGQTAPCGFVEDHALFVGHWNGSTFSVYDPDAHNNHGTARRADCGSNRTGHATAEWTKKELEAWSSGVVGRGQICAVTAQR